MGGERQPPTTGPTEATFSAGFGFPPRMRVREECAADSSLIFGGGLFQNPYHTVITIYFNLLSLFNYFCCIINTNNARDFVLAGGNGGVRQNCAVLNNNSCNETKQLCP